MTINKHLLRREMYVVSVFVLYVFASTADVHPKEPTPDIHYELIHDKPQ